jgi:competence protein ComEC
MAQRYPGFAPAALGPHGALARIWARWLAGASSVGWVWSRLLEERERWFLWLLVGVGLGIGLYFGLPHEPPVWLGPALVVPLALASVRLGRSPAGDEPSLAKPALIGLTAIVLGLTVASIRTQLVGAPVLERRGAYLVEGRVLLVEDQLRGERLLLGDLAVEGLAAEHTPARVRVSVRTSDITVRPGDRVQLRAILMPPSAPSEPHGFDFARQAYFAQLGAVGFALGKLERVRGAESSDWDLGLARLRQEIAGRIRAAVPGAAGGVAMALLTGLRGAIPDPVWRNMQIAGIAHLLAISGLHLGLVAGTLFFAVRVALALAPPLALRLPGKKIAAALALLGALAYLLLTGATVPTQRAFVMTALMLLAVMVDRNPFSMRLVAWAALVVLLSQPESLLGASFQMSFAAVVALIATYETGIARRGRATGLDGRLALYVGGVALTTIVASLATAPLTIYHFGRLATYGVAANLIAVPLTAFWIMPVGLLGLLLLPLGLDGPCFVLMGHGIELMLALAATIANWPGAAVYLARPPTAALTVTLLGGLWLCLWRTGWRRLGLLGVALGGLLMLLERPPDLLIDGRGELVAVRLEDGRLALSPWQRDRWITDGWLRSAGQASAAPWPTNGAVLDEALRCDGLGCVVSRGGRRIALSRRPEALEADCARADLVISYPRIERCPNSAPLIGPRALRDAGGLALWVSRSGIETLSVREVRGDRPWTR